jgi:uncharacterized repeat protein (TIGR01451 family)
MKKLFLSILLLQTLCSVAQTMTVSPNKGLRGQYLNVMFSGTGLDFQQGTSTTGVEFRQGSFTIQPWNQNTIDPNNATAWYYIPSSYPSGSYSAHWTGQTNSYSLPNKFTIDTATLIATPNKGARGQTLNVMFSGSNLNFEQGSGTTMVFSQGSSSFYANSFTGFTTNTGIGNYTIPADAPCGKYKAAWFGQGSNSMYLEMEDAFEVDCSSSVNGIVYNDKNGNGVQEAGENGLKNVKVNISPINATIYTDENGMYSAKLPVGTYSVSIDAPKYYTLSSTPTAHSVTSILNTVISGKDFGVKPGIHHDLAIDLVGPNPRIGFGRIYFASITNNGTTKQTPDIEITLNANQIVDSSEYPFTSLGANKYKIDLPSTDTIFPSETKTCWVQIKTNPVVALTGLPCTTSVKTLAHLTPEETIADNEYSYYTFFVNSFDPNDKSVSPKGVGAKKEVLIAETLEYVVRFQNTGNDVAYYVRIDDPLDARLDWGSLKVMGSSHTMTYFLADNGKAQFTFDNINLPDSGSNQAGSNGFVKYSIKLKPTNDDKFDVKNTAYIYFDFNTAVVTNTTNSYMVKKYSGIENIDPNNTIEMYPNPTRDILNISSTNDIKSIKMYDINGKKLEVLATSKSSNASIVDLRMIENGIYFLHIESENGTDIKKVNVIH